MHVVALVAAVRRLSRQLLFADLLPAGSPKDGERSVWRLGRRDGPNGPNDGDRECPVMVRDGQVPNSDPRIQSTLPPSFVSPSIASSPI